MVWIQRLNILGGRGSPVRDHGAGAPGAARFVAEFPGEDRGAGFVAVDDEFYVRLVCGLGFGVGVEGGVGAAEGGGVGVYAAEVVEVVEEGEDEFQAVGGGGGESVVEAADAGGAVHVEVLAGGVEDLVVDVCFRGGVVGCAEAPDAGGFEASL